MKIIYISFLLALLSLSTQAQTFDFNGETNTVLGSISNPDESEISVSWDVINISGSNRDVSCRREMIQEVAGSRGRFCWGPSCSPVNSGNFVLSQIVSMNDGDTSTTFRGYYRHMGFPGQSIARFCWFDVAEPSAELCYEVNFCIDQACVLGVKEFENQAKLQILGNPVTSLSGISFQFATQPTNAEIAIYNSTGQLVENRSINSAQGVVIIDAQLFANGVYTCKLNENGRTVGIQRMVVSK
jgi:hypothetical protein